MKYYQIVRNMDEYELAQWVSLNQAVIIKEYMKILYEAVTGEKEVPKEFSEIFDNEKIEKGLFSNAYQLLTMDVKVTPIEKDKKDEKTQ